MDHWCAGVIGVYEPAIFAEPSGERVTSRAAEGQAPVRSRDAYHRASQSPFARPTASGNERHG